MVSGSHAGDGNAADIGAQPGGGTEIFDPQCVVGLCQCPGDGFSAEGSRRRLPGGGIGDPLLQSLTQGGGVFRGIHGGCEGFEGSGIAAFASEGEGADAAQCLQQGHAAGGKYLRRRHGPGQGQFQNQIRSAGQRHLRPAALGQQGGLSPLGEMTAHDHGNVGGSRRPGGGNVGGMSGVEGVVFGDDPGNVHGKSLL